MGQCLFHSDTLCLGAHLLDAVLDEGWVSRVPGDRSLRVTERGRAALSALG